MAKSYMHLSPQPRPAKAKKQWRVLVKDLILDCHVGILPHERLQAQPVRFTVECDVETDSNTTPTDISEVVCYDRLVQGIQQMVKTDHIDLVETLAEKIADFCLQEPRIQKVFVRVEKLTIYNNVGSVGVELTREQHS
jgi:dihydroneopterin aldolase